MFQCRVRHYDFTWRMFFLNLHLSCVHPGFFLEVSEPTWMLHAASEIEFGSMEVDLEISFVN